tara:strand:- start:162 stop:932 length:771 start_codon:yes stop_codon:yes gene_type:complete
MPDRDEVIATQRIVIETFRSFRTPLMEVFGAVTFTRKADYSQLTKWDTEIEDTLREKLSDTVPNWGFCGEETGAHGSEETYWLIDPIDSTASFIRGLPFATNMAALVHEGETIAAVIYDFVQDRLYTALKGEGAYRDGRPISVNEQRKKGDYLGYAFARRTYGPVAEAGRELGLSVYLPVGAAGNAYLSLAEGKIDAVFAVGLSSARPYDHAPGMLIAEEAGAIVYSLDENQGVARNEFIIGAPRLIGEIERSGLF